MQSSCYWVYTAWDMWPEWQFVLVYANNSAQRVMAGGTVVNAGWLCNRCSSWMSLDALFIALVHKRTCCCCWRCDHEGCFTSFPFVSPFSIHSTVTLSLSSFSEVTIAWCIRPVKESEIEGKHIADRQHNTKHRAFLSHGCRDPLSLAFGWQVDQMVLFSTIFSTVLALQCFSSSLDTHRFT